MPGFSVPGQDRGGRKRKSQGLSAWGIPKSLMLTCLPSLETGVGVPSVPSDTCMSQGREAAAADHLILLYIDTTSHLCFIVAGTLLQQKEKAFSYPSTSLSFTLPACLGDRKPPACLQSGRKDRAGLYTALCTFLSHACGLHTKSTSILTGAMVDARACARAPPTRA